MKKEETKEAKEIRETEKKKRERRIFWQHVKFRFLAGIIGLFLCALTLSIIAGVVYGSCFYE